jgi:hypothetical protein
MSELLEGRSARGAAEIIQYTVEGAIPGGRS